MRMNRPGRWALLVAGAALLAATGAADAQSRGRSRDTGDRSDFTSRYGIVVDDNIFLRQRGVRPRPTPPLTTRPAPAPRSAEQSLMLTGIVFEDGTVRAYFENLSGGAPLRVEPGESVARGVVVDIAIDAVAYQGPDGIVRWVEIGQDLTGVRASVASSTPAPAGTSAGAGSTTTSSDTAAAPAGSDDADPSTLSVIERMRRNRQQLLNRNQ